jgi:hypothetical protein
MAEISEGHQPVLGGVQMAVQGLFGALYNISSSITSNIVKFSIGNIS